MKFAGKVLRIVGGLIGLAAAVFRFRVELPTPPCPPGNYLGIEQFGGTPWLRF
jgi:hypothetical protein